MDDIPEDLPGLESLEENEPPSSEGATESSTDSEVDMPHSVDERAQSHPFDALYPLQYRQQSYDEGFGGVEANYLGGPGSYWTQQGMSYQNAQQPLYFPTFPYSTATAPHLQHHKEVQAIPHVPQWMHHHAGIIPDTPQRSAAPHSTSTLNPFPTHPPAVAFAHSAPPLGNPPSALPSASSTDTPLLNWRRGVASSLSKSQKVKAVAAFLRKDLNMSPTDFLLAIVKSDDKSRELETLKSSFYSGTAIPRLLTAIRDSDKQGWPRLDNWYEDRALTVVLDRVDEEMTLLASEFVVAMKDLQPKRLMNFDIGNEVARVMDETSPWLRKILLRAAQSDRAKEENTKKNPLPVHRVF